MDSSLQILRDLSKGEQRYRELIETAAEAVMMIDVEAGVVIDVNVRACELLGRSREDLLGRPHASLFPQEHLAVCREVLENRQQRGASLYTDVAIMHASGREVAVDITFSEFMFGDRRILQCLMSEIGDRSLADRSLRRTNQALQALSSCNEALMHATDEEELLEDICRIIVCIAGYRYARISRYDAAGKGCLETVIAFGHTDDGLPMPAPPCSGVNDPDCPCARALSSSETVVINDVASEMADCPWKTHALTLGYHSVVAMPLVVRDNLYGVLLIHASEPGAFDSTALRHLHTLAEDIVFGIASLQLARERKRLQRQLQQAQKMEAIGQLTGGIAHDFNNMLASIIGYASLSRDIADQVGHEKLQDYLARIIHAGERARDLIAQMLAFSRGRSGDPVPVDLEVLLVEVISMMQATLPSSVHIDMDVASGLPMVLFDPIQFHQVLINLCVNARDAMHGNGTVTLCLRRYNESDRACASCHRMADGDYLELIVADTGEGMETDIQERIFDPFFSTKEIGKGTGMGLAMVHGIMHENGGHILLDSEPGRGTSFHLLFPVPPADMQLTGSAPVMPTTTEIEQTHGVIMIVDDEEAVAGYMQELFEMRGYRVIVRHDSLKALALLRRNPRACDVVITDLHMPGLDGIGLAERIAEMNPALPVLLSSGSREELDEVRSRMPSSVAEVLVKPLTNEVLLERVASVLKHGRQHQG